MAPCMAPPLNLPCSGSIHVSLDGYDMFTSSHSITVTVCNGKILTAKTLYM